MELPWFKRKIACAGSVLFRGTLPPRPEELTSLMKRVEARLLADQPNAHWALEVEHPKLGMAQVIALRDAPLPPRILLEHVLGLTPEEREEASAAGVSVSVRMEGHKGNVPRDRKNMLWFLRFVMGSDGVVAIDHLSEQFWSPAALDEELSHNAPLDVSALYSLHAVVEEEDEACQWLHSHGLGEIGAFDFDILRPSPDLNGTAQDGLRALAYAILEGAVSPATANFQLAYPHGNVRFVPAGDFHRHAAPADAQLRELDEDHTDKRAVLCQPVGGLFGRWSKRVKPSKFLTGDIPDGSVFHFSNAASNLMAERARKTYDVLRKLHEELSVFQFPVLAKLGYPTDGGGEDGREHLWFSIETLNDDSIVGTLENAPHNVSRLSHGDRGTHPLKLLSDWLILTPFGNINPRSMYGARFIRENREQMLAMINSDE